MAQERRIGLTNSTRKQSKSRFDYEALERRQLMTTFFVDNTGGSDTNDGLGLGSAFATIQQAADLAQPGDTVEIRGGTYREQVSLPRSGTEGNPIVFRAFNDEDVTITTTDILTGFTQTPETNDNPNVYVATLQGSTTNSLLNSHELTVFVDGVLVQAARNRNSADYLRSNTWSTVNSSGGNQLQDTDLIGVGDLTGGFIRVRTNAFAISNFNIIAHNTATGTVTLDRNVGNVNGRDYLAHDARSLVDSAGEWYFDEEANQFYIFVPGGGNPNNRVVEVTRRAEAFDTNGNDYLHFHDFRLTGGDFQTFANSAFNGPQSNNLLIQNVHVIAPDRNFGPDFGTTRTAVNFSGNNNIIRDSEFEQIWSAAVRINGSNNQVVNNYIHDAAFNGSGSGGVAINGAARNGSDNLISHNTFTRHGRSAIVVTDSERDLIQFNTFSEVALITADTGAVYNFNGNFGNSVYRYNTFFNINAELSTGFYVDNFVTDVVFHNNVTFGANAFGFKANQPNAFILQYNNTAFFNGRFDIAFPDFDSQYSSRFYNNITSNIDIDATRGSDPLDLSNNFISSSFGNFQNPNTGDFRLRPGSGAIDSGIEIPGITDGFTGSAPDAGAIEFGSPLFETGHDFDAAPNPVFDLGAPIYGSNLVSNSSFERGFAGFSRTGSPTIFNQLASNLRDAALNRYGRQGVLLQGGDGVSQTVTGLQPNTTYTLAAYAKPIREIIEAESRGPGSTNRPNGNVRGQTTVNGLRSGDVLVYDNVDFGDGSNFDELTLQIAQSNTNAFVQLRVDSPTGAVLDTIALPSNVGLVRSSDVLDVSGITGTRSVYLTFLGGTAGQLESLRFSNSADRIQLSASNFGGTDVSRNIGRRVHQGQVQRLTFTTGPSATSARLTLSNAAGNQFDGYVDYLSLAEANNPDSTFLQVDPDAVEYDYDLGTETSPVLNGFSRVSPDTNGGASITGNVTAIDRGNTPGINAANRDFITGTTSANFNQNITNGRYRVRVNLSDPLNDLDNQFVAAEGVVQVSGIDRAAGENGTITFEVDVRDSQLNLEFGDSDASNPRWALNRISIEQLEDFSAVDLTRTSFFYDLGSESSVLFNGNSDPYELLSASRTGDISFTGGTPQDFDRGATLGVNNINRDGVVVTGGTTLNHLIGDGVWSVLVNIGDRNFVRDDISISAEGQTFFTDVDRAVSSFGPNLTFEVAVSDGELNLSFDDLGGVNDDISITRVVLERVRDLPGPASVVGRQLFYNNSFHDGNNVGANSNDDAAIATDKTALLPGQTATFSNYSSFDKGINGVFIDIDSLGNAAALSAADFSLSTGNGGSFSDFSALTASPLVSVRPGQGAGGGDRVSLILPDGLVTGTWLSVTVQANGNTGLVENDVFYFGNAVGDTGNDTGLALVNSSDEIATRSNHRNFINRADVENIYDFNRDSLVTAIDESIARNNSTNSTNALGLITAPIPTPQPVTAPSIALAPAEELDQTVAEITTAPTAVQLPEPVFISTTAASVAPTAEPITVAPVTTAPVAVAPVAVASESLESESAPVLQSPDFLTPQGNLFSTSSPSSLFNVSSQNAAGPEVRQERVSSNNDLASTQAVASNDLLNEDYYTTSVDKGQQTDQLFEAFDGETLLEIEVFEF